MPCTLVRLAGCPLRCRYCDTPEALPVRSGTEVAIDAIVEEIERRNRPSVLITGGEPLAQKHTRTLLARLAERPRPVLLETAGAHPIADLPRPVHVILDIKTPGSGEVSRNRWENIEHLKPGDEIKFVLTDREDFDWMCRVIAERRLDRLGVPILASPAMPMLSPAQLARWILDARAPVRLQLQLHKYIWPTGEEGSAHLKPRSFAHR
ncbi:MAG: radical SAM protein [Zetaproteobacteria bacterium]|nr:MAG: radical SAM protein [Zetaproteobacteria bacterium]